MRAVLLAALITWMRTGVPPERVYEVAAHPAIPAIALAALDSGVYRTTDDGAHWQHVSDRALYSFTFNPFDAREVCAIIDGFREPAMIARAYCSEDHGATWSPMPSDSGISFLLFDRGTRDRMYAGVAYGNQWINVSSDHGKTWTAHGFTDGHPSFHGWAATDHNSNVFATSWPHGGTPYYYFTQSVYRSRDAGNNWVLIGDDPDRWIVANDSTIYFAVGSELRMSVNAGTTFERRSTLPVASIESLASDPARSRIVYAAGDNGRLFESLDAGATWSRIDAGAFRDRVVSISAGADGIVYAATADALFAMKVVGKRRGV